MIISHVVREAAMGVPGLLPSGAAPQAVTRTFADAIVQRLWLCLTIRWAPSLSVYASYQRRITGALHLRYHTDTRKI
jgi:hypothetical protein